MYVQFDATLVGNIRSPGGGTGAAGAGARKRTGASAAAMSGGTGDRGKRYKPRQMTRSRWRLQTALRRPSDTGAYVADVSVAEATMFALGRICSLIPFPFPLASSPPVLRSHGGL